MRKVVLFYIWIWAISINAQNNSLFVYSSSNSNKLIQSSMERGFVDVTRSYVLQDKDTKKKYGLNGNKYFGEVKSIGYKVRGGLLFLEPVVKPWDFDSNYDEYRNKYDGFANRVVIEAKDSVVYDSLVIKACNKQNLLYFAEDSLVAKGDGFVLNTTDGTKDGWMAWIVEENDSLKSLIIFKKKIEFKADSCVYEIEKPMTSKKVIGGIFVEPDYTSIGVVTFRLCGVMVRKDDKWLMARPTVVGSSALTVVEDSTKACEKKESDDSKLTPIEEPEQPDKEKKRSKKNKKK